MNMEEVNKSFILSIPHKRKKNIKLNEESIFSNHIKYHDIKPRSFCNILVAWLIKL